MTFDRIDRRLLERLQEDATVPLESLAREVHLTAGPVWRRIRRLEDAGVIERRVALCNSRLLKADVTVFACVRAARHDAAWTQQFLQGVRDLPQVTEVYRVCGEIDYLVKVAVPSMAAYDAVYRRLIGLAELADVSSMVTMETIKRTTALPVDPDEPP